MRLTNKTHWQTRDLRRIAARVVREEFPKDRFPNRARVRNFTVIVGYNRGRWGYSTGHAHYGANHCYVNVPSRDVDPIDFAHVVAHEIGHCKGLAHDRMPPHMQGYNRYVRTDYIRNHFAWAAALPIRRLEPKRKARPTADVKLAHAERMLAKAVTRRKRATTLERGWRRKVSYYTRRLTEGLAEAAKAAPPEES